MTSQALKNAAKRRKQAQGRRGLMRKAPDVPEPRAIERRYQAEMRALTDDLVREVKARLIDELPRLAQERDATRTRLDAWDEDVARLIESLTVFGRSRSERIINDLRDKANKIEGFNKKGMNRAIRAVIGVDLFGGVDGGDLEIAMRSWARENAQLIKGVTDKTMSDIEGITQRGLRSGAGPREITKDIQKALGKSKNNAKLIARDQVSKLNGQLTKQRNESLGIERYIWSTSQDERVRSSHSVMNGKLCRWDDASLYSDDGGKTWLQRSSIGGYIGHPGSDFQCRCVSSPVLDDVLASLDG